MRTPHNDAVAKAAAAGAPERTCVLTRTKGERGELVRLALASDGQVLPDVRARAPGRGAWLGVDRAALEPAVAKGRLRGALQRAFKTQGVEVPGDLPERVETALRQDALHRLGLEARAGNLLTGSERIEDAARKGQVELLLHAADAGADGARKLAQAWRVGRDEEGSGQQGLVLAAERTMLAGALGRDNVVHIAVVDPRAAERVARAVDRWHRFIGQSLTGYACSGTGQAAGQGAPGFEGLSSR